MVDTTIKCFRRQTNNSINIYKQIIFLCPAREKEKEREREIVAMCLGGVSENFGSVCIVSCVVFANFFILTWQRLELAFGLFPGG
jgi:hypothetical protein